MPGHFYYFSPKTLERMLATERFEMIGLQPSFKVIDLNRVLQVLARLGGARLEKSGYVEKWKSSDLSLKLKTELNFLTFASPEK